MHRARIRDEILARPRIAREELRRQEITLEAIASTARQDDVAWRVRTTVRQRMDMIERRKVELELGRAVNTSTAAVAHGCVFDRSLLRAWLDRLRSAIHAGSAGEGDTVKVPTS
jgi:hypothetical protein